MSAVEFADLIVLNTVITRREPSRTVATRRQSRRETSGIITHVLRRSPTCGAVSQSTPTNDTDQVVLASFAELTLVTGLVDASSYLKLGHVFTANMTGTIVFI